MTRYAKRVDENQAEIVQALRAAGAKVKVVHQPFDLLVFSSYRKTAKSMYVEVKNPKTQYGRAGLNEKQKEEAQGMPVATVDSVDAALRVLRTLRSGR